MQTASLQGSVAQSGAMGNKEDNKNSCGCV